MAKSISYNKRDNEKKKASKRKEKEERKLQRKASGTSSFDDMIAYVDENGMITSTPPDENLKKEQINSEDIDISTPKKETVEKESVLKGRVEHFNSSKGYGFIKSLSSVDKYFFHISNAPQNISEGNVVFFEIERGNRGMNAINIKFEE